MSNDDRVEMAERDSIIKELEAGIPAPGGRVEGVCAYHSSLARGMVWMIRRMDKQAIGPWAWLSILASNSPWAVATIVAAGVIVWIMSGCPAIPLFAQQTP